MTSKTIILSSQNSNGRAILTLFSEDDLLKCKIRLYNTAKLNRFCKLGIYHNKEVFSANLLEKEGVYLSSMVGDFNMENDFYCAIINTENNNEVILSGGTYSGFFFNDESVFENKFNRIEKEYPNTNLYNYEEDEILNETKIETDCEEDCEKCKNCKYKEWFYSHQQEETNFQMEQLEKRNENLVDISSNTFNDLEKPNVLEESANIQNEHEETKVLPNLVNQFNSVFENYPEDKTLTILIPNSKFVKINENGNNYSIGAIFDGDEMKYICYAVMCEYNAQVPSEIGEHYQWLPLDKEDPMSEGYYIVFQDAKDLKIVEM